MIPAHTDPREENILLRHKLYQLIEENRQLKARLAVVEDWHGKAKGIE